MRPFKLPDVIEPRLAQFLEFWDGLRRAGNEIPFWDDLRMGALPQSSAMMLLLDAFESPQRFRFQTVAPELAERYGEALTGRFANEIQARFPFDYIASQCSATAESRAPTYHEQAGDRNRAEGYARILLPLWGEGSVRMLLGATTWLATGAVPQEWR